VYELIHAERANIPVARACRVLRVSRSGYYQWLHREPSTRSIDDSVLAAEVTEVFHEHLGRYGAPRVRGALRRRGARPSKKRIARVMRNLGLRGHTPRRFRKTTDSRHTKRIAPNLLQRDFNVVAPNQVVAGDITYVQTVDGWLYLAVLLDLYSRRVVGWAMSDRIDTELALSALRMAASGARLDPPHRPRLQVRQR
jgi:putative transposase